MVRLKIWGRSARQGHEPGRVVQVIQMNSGDGTPCQCSRCGADVILSDFAMAVGRRLAKFCKQRGWAPLTRHEVALCAACRDAWLSERRDESRREHAQERAQSAQRRAARVAEDEQNFYDSLK